MSGLWGLPRELLERIADCIPRWPQLARQFLHSGDGGSRDHRSDIVGSRLSGTEALHVTAVAEQMSVKGEAAATFLIAQLHAAVLRKKATSSPRAPYMLRGSQGSVCLCCSMSNSRGLKGWMVARRGG